MQKTGSSGASPGDHTHKAHLLRELQAVTDHHATTDTADAWCWADQVARALLALHHAAAATPERPVDADTIAEHTMLIRHALLAATHPAGALGRKHRALARRIHKRETDYLKFAHIPAIPFTNNSAEQEIRMTKIRQKVSGTMRTGKGAGHFADRAPTYKPPRNTAYQHSPPSPS